MLKTLIHTDLHMFYSILFNPRQSAKSVVKNRKYNSHFFCKTKPIYSLCVLRPFDFAQDKDAYCERNLKKQSQFLLGLNLRKFFEINRICEIIRFRGMKKTNPNKANSPAFGRKLEALSTKS